MEAWDLKFVKFHIEGLDEVFENIAALSHQFGCLLVGKAFMHVLVRSFKVWEEENEDFFGISWDLNEIYMILNLMEVSVEDLASHFNSILIEPDIHRWWTFLCNDV